jgi:diguanylate cyclase
MHDLRALPNFSEAASTILRFLHERTGVDLWMATRTEGEDWIVLAEHDHGYGVEAGKVFRWSDSFCSRMVADQGPRVATDSRAVPAYADAPLAKQLPIRAYIGVPLSRADGTLFGTLCGLHREVKSEALHAELPLVELLAKLLSSLLISELAAHEQARRAERAEAELLTDSLTGLFNRRGWDSLLAAEESRCKRYGHPACVLSIDLDELKQVNDSEGHARGDELLKATADVLRSASRQQDVMARVGGDEFAVLAVECDVMGGQALVERLLNAFTSAGVKASIGIAPRRPSETLDRAWLESDRLMYSHKKRERMATP